MVSEDKSGQFNRGLRAFRSGDYQTAVELLSDAVEYEEQNDRAWNALGTACAKIGRYEDADLCFENALTLAPDNPIYVKNRKTNVKHLKNPPLFSEKSGKTGLFDHIPFDKIPIDKPLVLIGIGAGLIIIIVLTLFGVLSLFSAPAAQQGPGIVLSVNQSGTDIILLNEGGREIKSVSSFSWKVNDIPIGSGKPDDPGTLSVTSGSIAVAPLSSLTSTNLSAGLRVMVIATNKDGSSSVVLSTTLPPPAPGTIPIQPVTPVATPTHPPNLPLFKSGEIIQDTSSHMWWLIATTPVNDTYVVTHAARLPNGTFTSLDSTTTNISFISFEPDKISIGTRDSGGTPAGLSSVLPPPVIGIPATHPQPAYTSGDLINSAPTGDDGMMVILGYDPITDQYQADTISKYYTGEWGYRLNTTPKWFIRPILEQQLSHRPGRITMSDIGIGADSAPPRTPVKYVPGDIISPNPSGVEREIVIIGYNKTDDQYQIDTIASAYDGGWKMAGTPTWEKRVFVERNNPYQLRKIDLSLVRS